MGTTVSGQKRSLEKEYAGSPCRLAPSEPGKDVFANNGLNLEKEKRTEKNRQSKDCHIYSSKLPGRQYPFPLLRRADVGICCGVEGVAYSAEHGNYGNTWGKVCLKFIRAHYASGFVRLWKTLSKIPTGGREIGSSPIDEQYEAPVIVEIELVQGTRWSIKSLRCQRYRTNDKRRGINPLRSQP